MKRGEWGKEEGGGDGAALGRIERRRVKKGGEVKAEEEEEEGPSLPFFFFFFFSTSNFLPLPSFLPLSALRRRRRLLFSDRVESGEEKEGRTDGEREGRS